MHFVSCTSHNILSRTTEFKITTISVKRYIIFVMYSFAPQGGKVGQSSPKNPSAKMLADVVADLPTWLT